MSLRETLKNGLNRLLSMRRGSTNPILISLIEELNASEAPIWRDVAKRLSKPSRIRPEVNVSRLQRYANNGEYIVVPGKLLGAGIIDKKVNVAAFSFSNVAREKIEKSGGKCLSIEEMMKEKPKGSKVRLFQ